MLCSLLTPESNSLQIAIPDDYIGKKVEVLVFKYDDVAETKKASQNVMAQFWAVVSKHTTKEMHQHVVKSRNEWKRDLIVHS